MSKSKGQIIETTEIPVMNRWWVHENPSNSLRNGMAGRTEPMGTGRLCTGIEEPGDIMGAVEGWLVWLECSRKLLGSQGQQQTPRNRLGSYHWSGSNDSSCLLQELNLEMTRENAARSRTSTMKTSWCFHIKAINWSCLIIFHYLGFKAWIE